MSYKSENKLTLSEKPLTSDPDVFPDMNDVYSSIHLLNDWVTQVQNNLTSGEDVIDPDKAMPFRTWFWSTAGEANPAGTIVTPLKAGRYRDEDGDNIDIIDGYYKGCGSAQLNLYDRFLPRQGNSNGMFGIQLDESASPGDIVRIGIGPGILKIEEALLGDTLFCFPALIPDTESSITDIKGQFLENRGGVATKAYLQMLPIGHVVANDYVLLGFRVDDYLYRMNSTPPAPLPENT